MPLNRRLKQEIRAEWLSHSIKYKDLQRKAEEQVGECDEEDELVLRNHLDYCIERTTNFFNAKAEEVQTKFQACSQAVSRIAEVHDEREAKKFLELPFSPNDATSLSWQAAEAVFADAEAEAELECLKNSFSAWRSAVQEHRQAHTFHLADFLDTSFMVQLEHGALKDALLDWLSLLMLIDDLRTFAILNSVGLLKLLDRHCSTATQQALRPGLVAGPLITMKPLCEVVLEMESVARQLSELLQDDYQAPASPASCSSRWSLHVCPMCNQSVSNPVVLPDGLRCCFGCCVDASSHSILECPRTCKSIDLRWLRVEKMLSSFLQRYFPSTLKSAPSELIGFGRTASLGAKPAEPAKPAPCGILSMRKKALEITIPECTDDRRKRRIRKVGSVNDILKVSSLDAEVSKMLQALHLTRTAAQNTAPHTRDHAARAPRDLEPRDRSISLPMAPPRLSDLVSAGGAGIASTRRKQVCTDLASLEQQLAA